MERKLRLLREKLENSNNIADIEILNQLLLIEEDTSATGGSIGASIGGDVGGVGTNISGMGSVINSQPSSYPGALNGNAWASGGGESGSGDISVPYNPSGGNRMFQKLAAPMGNKKFKKKDIRIEKPNKIGKLMKFSDYTKDKINQVTKVKESSETLEKTPKVGDLIDTYSMGTMSIKNIEGNLAWINDVRFYEIDKLSYAGDNLWYSPAAKKFYESI